MGTTLENGVYLPSEGERNCYAGLKTNWEILDQKVADVTALQQAVAGALHRQIVASLPTTDIDPNTIYMILSGTSATENVYNEFMYVNNAWELIGTSATDLTNYYTKAEVDGKLLLKANTSDLTSHTGDTTIHVTASDKTKWTNSANAVVFRYSSTALTASSTNSNTLLDNTDNLKVGDKVIDSSGVLFSITAIDTQNSTFTVGTALIDLAQDSDVVHKSGDETVAGFKQFANIRVNNSIKAINLDSTTTDLDNCYSDFAPYGENKGGNIQYYHCNTDAGTANISNLPEAKAFFLTSITTRLISNSLYVKQVLINSNSKTFTRYCANSTWSSWVNETDSEYVHKTGNETVGGAKTFSDNLTIYNSDDTVTPKGLTIRNAQWIMGESGGTTVSNISFLDKNSSIPVSIMASKGLSGQSYLRFSVRTRDSQNNTYSEELYYDIDTSGNVEFRSWHDNIISLGTSAYKWKDVQTYKVNALEPSSLSLPSGNANDVIDISSYITDLNGGINEYTAPANGWITVTCLGCTGIKFSIIDFWADGSYRENPSQISCMIPICKNQKVGIYIYGSSPTVQTARFIPCQGNV